MQGTGGGLFKGSPWVGTSIVLRLCGSVRPGLGKSQKKPIGFLFEKQTCKPTDVEKEKMPQCTKIRYITALEPPQRSVQPKPPGGKVRGKAGMRLKEGEGCSRRPTNCVVTPGPCSETAFRTSHRFATSSDTPLLPPTSSLEKRPSSHPEQPFRLCQKKAPSRLVRK